MKQGIVFILTGVITITTMTALGFLIKNNTAPVTNAADGDAQLQQVYMDREATYQAVITDANQRLKQANLDLQALSTRVTQLQQEHPFDSASSIGEYPISAEQAIEIANSVSVDEVADQTAELVDFEGAVAYEVIYTNGPVYVDASSGAILYNSLGDSSTRSITQEEAVKIASDYLGINDIYQVDQIISGGRVLIRVIFSQGHMVYLDLTGQIVYIQKVTRYDPNNVTTISSSSDSGGSSNDDEHEDHDDDDDDDDD